MKRRTVSKRLVRRCAHFVVAGLVGVFISSGAVFAQGSVCAEVRLEILQRLTFERVAFDARLIVTNSLPDQALQEFGVTLNIRTADGDEAGQLFFVTTRSLDNIDAVDGTGTLPAGARAEAHWLIIPSAGAGGSVPAGQTYLVGGSVQFTGTGELQQLPLIPAPIVVKPQPTLQVDYFLPQTVRADDPFTPEVEAPVPFSLGTRVKNTGFGTARNLEITSGQPRIVENEQGLLIGFQLTGTSVNGQPVTPTLNASFGTIGPGECGIVSWQMITTLSGRFTDFEAQYTHAPELGGDLTSLIAGTSTSTLVREMLVDLPGRDGLPDFLADVDDDPDVLPDQIFESDCSELPVNHVAGSTTGIPGFGNPEVGLSTDVLPGWVFARVPDPAQGLTPLSHVLRSDGKQLRSENTWISRVQDDDVPSSFNFFLNIIDFETTGSYTLFYQEPEPDLLPPTTSIVFQEPSFGADPVFITPETQILFVATDDISGVSAIEFRLDDAPDFQPGLPFTIEDPGTHEITYRSTDNAGNIEPDRIAQVVDPDPPSIAPLVPVPAEFFPAAPEGVGAVRSTVLTVVASDAIPELQGNLEVAAGTGEFAALPLVRSIQFSLQSNVPQDVVWDGRDENGVPVAQGTYTIRVTIADPLGHESQVMATVQVSEFANDDPVQQETDADQQYPELAGNYLVWQDNRADNWDVFALNLESGAEENLTSGESSDQQRPEADGSYVVWQDLRNGNWDIFLHDLAVGTTTALTTSVEDQQRPVVEWPWVVWQETRGGDRDVVALNLDTSETVEISAGAPGVHDQIRPAISGTRVVFEDYRNGLADIYVYDLQTRVEQRITDDVNGQTHPTIHGDTIVWVDTRDQNRELYSYDLTTGVERRLTYTPTDESQPGLHGSRLAFVDFLAGFDDPAVSLLDLDTGRSVRITSDPAQQEEPAVDSMRVVWQDDRTGRWRIRVSDIQLGSLAIGRMLGDGFNLVGLTDATAATYPSAFSLLAAWNATSGVTEIRKLEQATGAMLRANIGLGGTPEGDDFDIAATDGLLLESDGTTNLDVESPVTCLAPDLAIGANYVSLSCAPAGFTAGNWLELLGLADIASIARFDPISGRWETLAVAGGSVIGSDFPIVPGEGYLIHARQAVSGVLP